jgi:hypothetical protein
MNDLPEESKKINYIREDCKCKKCVENFLYKTMANCFNLPVGCIKKLIIENGEITSLNLIVSKI